MIKEESVSQDEAIVEHISAIENMNFTFLAISLSLLVFPLSLYTPESSYLIVLALLGYVCSWGFLISAATGICLRLRTFKSRFGVKLRTARKELVGQSRHAIASTVVSLVSIYALMAVPFLYVGTLPRPVGSIPVIPVVGFALDLDVMALVMLVIWVVGTVSTLHVIRRAYW